MPRTSADAVALAGSLFLLRSPGWSRRPNSVAPPPRCSAPSSTGCRPTGLLASMVRCWKRIAPTPPMPGPLPPRLIGAGRRRVARRGRQRGRQPADEAACVAVRATDIAGDQAAAQSASQQGATAGAQSAAGPSVDTEALGSVG